MNNAGQKNTLPMIFTENCEAKMVIIKAFKLLYWAGAKKRIALEKQSYDEAAHLRDVQNLAKKKLVGVTFKIR
jgi:hypothetical protein